MNNKKTRAVGCFMGMVVGDALDAQLEFFELNYNSKNLTVNMTYSTKAGLKPG